jgi:hypothetical protein
MNPNPLPPEGYQGPPGYPSSQPPVAINQDPNAQYFPPQPSEQARLPTEGNDAPPNTYMKPQPQPYNAYVKHLMFLLIIFLLNLSINLLM